MILDTLTLAGFAWRLLLAIASLGVLTSTVYLGMVLVAAYRFRGKMARPHGNGGLPGVTVLKPVHGLEPRMEENLESFFQQDYPNFEIIFGARALDDPALAVVEKLRRRYPRIPVQIVLSGPPTWPNAKVFSLSKMIAVAGHSYLVISDSDILAAPGFLRSVIAPLLDPKIGLVTCLYKGIPAPGFWSALEAIGMSVELPSGVLVANMLEGMRFALGAVMATRKDCLEKIGGIANTADYYSDDFVLGSLISGAGYEVVLSEHMVGHVLVARSPSKSLGDQLRWMKSTRYSRPKGHVGTGLTFGTPFGLLALIAATALGEVPLGAALFAWTAVGRMLQSVVIGWGIIGDRRALRLPWLFAVRDFIGFFIWAASFAGGSAFFWRGETYHFTPGGRIVPEHRIVGADRQEIPAKQNQSSNAGQ
jgi:ceramide glucosyltransferase